MDIMMNLLKYPEHKITFIFLCQNKQVDKFYQYL